MTPRALMNILSIPGTNEQPVFKIYETAQGEPYRGWVEDQNGHQIATLKDFRFEFVDFAPVTAEARSAFAAGAREALINKPLFVEIGSDRVEWRGGKIVVADYIIGFDTVQSESSLLFRSNAVMVDVCLHAHAWSGIAAIEVNGSLFCEIDLFNLETALRRKVRIDNPSGEAMEIVIRPSGKRHANALGLQMLAEGFIEHLPELIAPVYQKSPPINHGGAFLDRFFEIRDQLPPNAIILDVGGGKRQLADDRYINLEYSSYEEPDILGDGTKLPFLDSSVDFVYTAAVLEHVPDPLQMGREIFRVLKPGGKVLANSAFMQPVHSEGQHFFNLTPYGIDLVFKPFSEKRVWWNANFGFTTEWFINEMGVRGRASDEDIDQLITLAKRVGEHVTPDRAMYVASDVWLEGVK